MNHSHQPETPARAAALERRICALTAENRRLRNLLKVTDGLAPPPEQPMLVPPDPGVVTNSSSLDAKLALYWRLFAARRDVYARYWENPRKGTKGWLPAVRDPWRKGSLWDRRPLPLTLEVIAEHLHRDGEVFAGLYPLLPDGTCWWLAADFDGPQAMLDAHAYVKAASSLGVPCGLEISQSGRGAHVWTFFTSPVPATDARALGTACVHLAMGLRGSMPLASYDRLFPSQDTVPTGSSGVGNLIAAPLNGKRRTERGTTLFVDMAIWEPFADQWEYLSCLLDRLTPAQVTAIVRKAPKVVVGRDVTRLENSRATAVQPRLPAQVRGTLGAQVRIQDEDLTASSAASLRHAATIHNRAFYEAQRARRSTWNIPRFIRGFDVAANGDLILPRGLRHQVADLIAQAGSTLLCHDERVQGSELGVTFLGELDDRQMAAVDEMLTHEDGILHAPTGSGKTVMACAIIAERAVSTLILIDKTALAAQWRDQVRAFLGIKAGQLGGGRAKTRGQVDIMLLQTLARHTPDEIRELTGGYGHVVVDECHHVAAGSYESVISQIGAAWWLGLTATPERKDGLEPITTWQLGPIRHVMRDTLPGDADLVTPFDGPLRILRVHETTFRLPKDFDLTHPGAITQLGGILADDAVRNRLVADAIQEALTQGRKCLVLSRRRDHLTTLAEMLPDAESPTAKWASQNDPLPPAEKLLSGGVTGTIPGLGGPPSPSWPTSPSCATSYATRPSSAPVPIQRICRVDVTMESWKGRTPRSAPKDHSGPDRKG
jgi:hypothetical protein